MKILSKPGRAYKALLLTLTALAGGYGLHLAGEAALPRLADETPAALRQTGLTRRDIRAMTGGAVTIMRPQNGLALAYAYATARREQITMATSARAAPRSSVFHPFGAVGSRDPLFGNGFAGDRLTHGLSGKIFPCAVTFPDGAVNPWQLAGELSRLSVLAKAGGDFNHLPPRAQELGKILLLHEVAHCGLPSEFTGANEAEADKKAVAAYLEQGGDREVALSFIYLRTLGSLANALGDGDWSGDATDPHVSGPALYHRFFGGRPMDYDGSVYAYKLAAQALERYNRNAPLEERSPGGKNDEKFFARIEALLAEPNAALTPDTRQVLALSLQAWKFFNPPPPAAPAYRGEMTHAL